MIQSTFFSLFSGKHNKYGNSFQIGSKADVSNHNFWTTGPTTTLQLTIKFVVESWLPETTSTRHKFLKAKAPKIKQNHRHLSANAKRKLYRSAHTTTKARLRKGPSTCPSRNLQGKYVRMPFLGVDDGDALRCASAKEQREEVWAHSVEKFDFSSLTFCQLQLSI